MVSNYREFDANLALTSSSHHQFSSYEIIQATNNFDPKSIFSNSDTDFVEYVANISEYVTPISDIEYTLAYVKRFSSSGYGFAKEVVTFTKIQVHTNIISLIGYCIDSGERILVFTYMDNGRLKDYVKKRYDIWSWKKRLEICLEIAYGLQYLHTPTTVFSYGITHGSIYLANILLDENWHAKITNFNHSTHDTMGAPMDDLISKVNDVYDFGTILIKVLCWNNDLYQSGFYDKYEDIGFGALAKKEIAIGSEDVLSPDSVYAFSEAIKKCLQPNKYDRPHIDAVVLDLESAFNFQEVFLSQSIPTTLDGVNSSSTRSESRIMEGVSESDSFDDFNSSSSLRIFYACQQFSWEEVKMATNNFDMEKCLGKGGEATVYLGEIYLHSRAEKSIVAVKHLEKGFTSTFEKEIATVAKFRHPNIVSLFGYCKESNEKVLIYEYMGKGSLCDYVKTNSKVCLSWKQRLNICLNAAKGLQFLHKETEEFPKGIIHRDVKPENILIDDNWVAKVSDFGMLKLSSMSQTTSIMSTLNIKGTPGYFAPESLHFKKLSKKIDVYAFGFVMFEVLCRKKRWEIFVDKSIYLEDDDDIGLLARENIDSKIKHEIANSSQQVFIDIIVESMQYDPKERPTMDKVVLKLEEALEYQEQSDD